MYISSGPLRLFAKRPFTNLFSQSIPHRRVLSQKVLASRPAVTKLRKNRYGQTTMTHTRVTIG